MVTIIFVCHGNICRSPAAEFFARSYIKGAGKETEYIIFSRATSREEIGNDIYPPMKTELTRNGIDIYAHKAKQIRREELDSADYIFYMDANNLKNLEKMFGYSKKYVPIYQFSEGIYQIEDPWYSDRYNLVVEQIKRCVIDIFKHI